MNNHAFHLLLVLVASFSMLSYCATSATVTVFWSGNNHAYQLWDAGKALTYQEAQAFANTKYVNGQQGYLVTISSAAEQDQLQNIYSQADPHQGTAYPTLWAGAVREGNGWFWYALTRKSNSFYDVSKLSCNLYCNWYNNTFPDNNTCLQVYSANNGGPTPGTWTPASCNSVSEDVILEFDPGNKCDQGYTLDPSSGVCKPNSNPTTTTPSPTTTTLSPSTSTMTPSTSTTMAPTSTTMTPSTTTTTMTPSTTTTEEPTTTTTTTTTTNPPTSTTMEPTSSTTTQAPTTTTMMPSTTTTMMPSTTTTMMPSTTTTMTPSTTTTRSPNSTTTMAPSTTTTAPTTTTTRTPTTTTTNAPSTTTTTRTPTTTTTAPTTTTTRTPTTTTTSTRTPSTTTTNSPNTTTTRGPTTTTRTPSTTTTRTPPAGSPIITNITMVSTQGGVLTIFGANFGNNDTLVSVVVGGLKCTNVHIKDGNVITCNLGEGVGKNLPVVITVGGLTNAANNAFSRSPPRVIAVQVHTPKIIIAGANFGGVASYVETQANGIKCITREVTHANLVCDFNTTEANWINDPKVDVTLTVNVFGQVTTYTIPSEDFINGASRLNILGFISLCMLFVFILL